MFQKIFVVNILKKKDERSSSVPHISNADRKKIQRSQTDGGKGQKKQNVCIYIVYII